MEQKLEQLMNDIEQEGFRWLMRVAPIGQEHAGRYFANVYDEEFHNTSGASGVCGKAYHDNRLAALTQAYQKCYRQKFTRAMS